MHRRFTLLESSSSGGNEKPQETLRTADLDNHGLLQMQRNVMSEQDTELADLEATVGSTKVDFNAPLTPVVRGRFSIFTPSVSSATIASPV